MSDAAIVRQTVISEPSPVTTETVDRAVTNATNTLATRIAALEKTIEAAHQDLVRVPTDVQQAVAGVHALTDTKLEIYKEKFHSIEVQFTERNNRFVGLLDSISDRVKDHETHANNLASVISQHAVQVEANTKEAINRALAAASAETGALKEKIEAVEKNSNLKTSFGAAAVVVGMAIAMWGIFQSNTHSVPADVAAMVKQNSEAIQALIVRSKP